MQYLKYDKIDIRPFYFSGSDILCLLLSTSAIQAATLTSRDNKVRGREFLETISDQNILRLLLDLFWLSL